MASVAAPISPESLAIPKARGFRHRWYRTPSFVAGVIIVGAMVGLALLAPVIAPYNPDHQDLNNILAGLLVAPLAGHR